MNCYFNLHFYFTEKGDTKTKIEALKKTILMIANGERLPNLLMIIIRFVLPLQDHTIKKLLLIFWEIVPKTSPDGKLLQEMILVCDAYRKVSLLILNTWSKVVLLTYFIFILSVHFFYPKNKSTNMLKNLEQAGDQACPVSLNCHWILTNY